MSSHLPKAVIPEQLAASEEVLTGTLSLSDMPRLASYLQKAEGEVQIKLKFALDEQNFVVIYGKISASLPLLCQRCFKPMIYDLESSFSLSPVNSDAEAERLPESYEPLLKANDLIVILDMIEEELLLVLPLVPMHPSAVCSVKLTVSSDKPELSQKANPFAALKKLKNKLRS